MNKRKILSLAMALSIVAIMAVGATLAYFTDTDEAENVFVVGNVNIQQNEYQRDPETKEIEAFEDDKVAYPAVLDKLTKGAITVDGYDFQIRSLEGNYLDKIVNVTNNGTEEAYVRTIIAIPNMNGYDDASPAENPLHWNYLDATDFEGGWNWSGSKTGAAGDQTDKIAEVNIGGKEYDLYVATHTAAVAANTTTSPSMVGFYLDDNVDYDENGYFSMQNGQRIDLSDWMTVGEDGKVELKILVATQAVQTKGFADAWEALDEAFGDISASNHPWVD